MGILVHIFHRSLVLPIVEALNKFAPDIPVWSRVEEAPPEEVECLLAWSLKEGVAPSFPNLRLISAPSAGVDKLLSAPDLPAGVPITRVVDPDQSRYIAQYVAAVTLQHTRELERYRVQQQQGEWARHDVRPARSIRIGVLGLGDLGSTVARTMEALGFSVAGWSRSKKTIAGVETLAGDDQLDTLLSRSDVLVCTLPLTTATRGILQKRTLARLPKGAFVVNVGRGEHVVDEDLLALLDSGHLGGAALDVFTVEPLPAESPFWRHPRIVLTPHIAAPASFDLIAQQCAENLRRIRAGQPPLNVVDRTQGY